MAVDIVKGPIGHWEQTNAVFSFWQQIVDLEPFYKISAPAVAADAAPIGASTETQFALDPRFRGDDGGVALGLSGPFQGSHVFFKGQPRLSLLPDFPIANPLRSRRPLRFGALSTSSITETPAYVHALF